MQRTILDRPVSDWVERFPLLDDMMQLREVFWCNPKLLPFAEAAKHSALGMADIHDAAQRLARFAPYLLRAFPETAATQGIIESPLREIPRMKAALSQQGARIPGRLFLKLDSHLPISGSIKARGGIYEVLKFAEDVARREGLLETDTGYEAFCSERFQSVLQTYSVAVGSTGNLGLSIGIMSAKLGFRVTVHMSADAKQWKKDLLRSRGVRVVEYADDYSRAVAEGRRLAAQDARCHFVDDENSQTLFLGYAVAALRLKEQLAAAGIPVDASHPLFVYLPCGVGGGPGGVCFGLKQVFGDHVHCFFSEPTHAPCMLLGLYTGLHDSVCVQELGIDNRTDADGLAVGRASRFVGRMIEPLLSGAQSVTDEHMYRLLGMLAQSEGILLEPSALAGMPGPQALLSSQEGKQYLAAHGLSGALEQATHLVWATGGAMVPPDVMQGYLARARRESLGRAASAT